MLDNDKLAWSAARFKTDASREFDKVVKALVALAFKYAKAGADFLWDMDPELNDEANRLLRQLSDDLVEKAKAEARAIFDDEWDEDDFEEAWERELNDGILTRFDMEGSHLKELLEIWIALAFVNGISQGELRVLISRYLSNPFTSPLWSGLPTDILKWGSGYSRNIVNQLAVIGQNAVISSARFAEWRNAMANGATYYIRRRGSSYHCPECDEMCGYAIPISTPFQFLHSRCMCWPEYHYEPMQ